MKYPKLVRKEHCKTPVDVVIYQEGISEDGEPMVASEFQGLHCNYQDKAHTVLTADRKLVQLSGKAYFHEDFCPDISTISGGKITVFGEVRNIHSGRKNRNPDGTVNNVEIEVQ